MAIFGRVTIFWWLSAFFILFIVLKLDNSIDWLWSVVFTPMWILDLLALIFLTTFLVLHFRSGRRPFGMNELLTKEREIYLLFVFLFKWVFELLLCLKLDGYINVTVYYIFIPLWMLLLLLVGDTCRITWKERHNHERDTQYWLIKWTYPNEYFLLHHAFHPLMG